jgi:predicted RNA-binding protein with TRAM domain
MDIPAQLRCLFAATVEERDDSYVIEVPAQELRLGDLKQGETYRVALLSASTDNDAEQAETVSQTEHMPPKPPVEVGEQRTVEIENIGDQGDGITRVDRGFVVIVPDTDVGERVIIEITDMGQNVAFAEVVKRLNYQ